METPTPREIVHPLGSTRLLDSIAEEDLVDLAAKSRRLDFRTGELAFSRHSVAGSVSLAIEGRREIRHGLSQQDRADSLSLTGVMLNRQLGLWRARGLISIERGSTRVADLQALEDTGRNRSACRSPI